MVLDCEQRLGKARSKRRRQEVVSCADVEGGHVSAMCRMRTLPLSEERGRGVKAGFDRLRFEGAQNILASRVPRARALW